MGKKPEDILHQHQLRKTAGRELVLHYFMGRPQAVSHGELDAALGQKINRASLYRVLRDFEQSGIIHKVPDDEVSIKFAYCGSDCHVGQHRDNHVHFKCENCGETRCLEEVNLPNLQLPQALEVRSTSVLVSGLCNTCVV